MSFPIPKVTVAAAKPKRTCLKPENQTFLPVNKVMAAPIRNKPTALTMALVYTAMFPFRKKKGSTGRMAPAAKRKKEKRKKEKNINYFRCSPE